MQKVLNLKKALQSTLKYYAMNKLLLILATLISSFCFTQNKSLTSNLDFNITKDEIKKIINEKPFSEDEISLAYKTTNKNTSSFKFYKFDPTSKKVISKTTGFSHQSALELTDQIKRFQKSSNFFKTNKNLEFIDDSKIPDTCRDILSACIISGKAELKYYFVNKSIKIVYSLLKKEDNYIEMYSIFKL